jgi:uncharacterized cupin superfamily protein
MEFKQYRRQTLIFVSGAVVALILAAGVQVLSATSMYADYKEKLAKPERMAISALAVNPSWIVSGSPVFRIGGYGNSADKVTQAGFWECIGPAKFVWHYGGDESILILEGSVEIEYLGKKFTLSAGESAHFAAGTKATWVVNERVKKTFAVHKVGFLAKLARRLSM